MRRCRPTRPVTNPVRRIASRGPRAVGAALLVAGAAGCGTAVDGGPGPAEPVPRPTLDISMGLPTAAQVAQAVGNPLDPAGPGRVGGIELLPNGIRDSDDVSPLDCLGAATPLMRVVYESGYTNAHENGNAGAAVTGVALQDFARYGAGLTVSGAHTGVVRLSSEAEAARLFEAFAAQWRACEGTTVSVHVAPGSSVDWEVTDVREDDGILSATILTADSGGQPPLPTEHALGIVADCIVEADVAVTAALPELRVATGRAVELVRTMRDDLAAGN